MTNNILMTIAGIDIPKYDRTGIDYSTCVNYINTITPNTTPMHTGDVKTQKEWNDFLNISLTPHMNKITYIHPQKGIQGNQSGIICIKSTEFGRMRYSDDRMKPEKGFIYYETSTNGSNLFYKRYDNYGLICAFKFKKKFFCFQGKTKELKYIGLGEIKDIYPNSTGQRAILKIRVYTQ